MKRYASVTIGIILLMVLIAVILVRLLDMSDDPDDFLAEPESFFATIVALPAPDLEGSSSLESALVTRRSGRDFDSLPLSQKQLAQLLWAAQGITESDTGYRTAPSAGALYPLTLYVLVADVDHMRPGIYVYDPSNHSLQGVRSGDRRRALFDAGLEQAALIDAPATLLISADYAVTEPRYGQRSERYVHLEAGHVGQNICLQAQTLGLSTVPIGAFQDNDIRQLFLLADNIAPLYLFPVGYPLDD